MGQQIREDGPATHQSKAGTPTMGGLLIVAAMVVPTLLWANLANRSIWLVLFATLGLGALGFLDDYLHVVRRRRKGLLGRWKLVGQGLVGAVVGVGILLLHPFGQEPATVTTVPFLKNVIIDFGILYVPFVVLVVTASSNAVNLADGLDGLAIGLVVPPADRLRRAGLCLGQRRLRALPEHPVPGGERRTGGLRGRAGGRGARLPLVQRPSGAGLHGRHRQPRAGRLARRAGGAGEAGAAPASSWAGSSSPRRSRS